MSLVFYPLQVKEIREETSSCKSILFEIPEELRSIFKFQSGQYVTIKSDKTGDDVRRSYSICSIPEEDELRVAVKKLNGGKFSCFVHQELKEGDILDVLPPMGTFCPHFTKDKSGNSVIQITKKTYVLVAVGSGITPVFSIAKNILNSEPDSEVVLIYGNRNQSSIIFKEQLEALKNKNMKRFSLYHVFTQEKMEANILNGRIDATKIHYFLNHILDQNAISEVFICGPEEMMLSTKTAFINAGINQKNVHIELFFSEEADLLLKKRQAIEISNPTLEQDRSKANQIRLELDGRWLEYSLGYPEQTLLDAALKNGADLPYACRGGVCATCKCKLIEGEVEMDINYALEQDELDQGFILACQSHPLTENVTISFDFK